MKRAKKKEAELKPKILRKGSNLSQSKQNKVDDTIIDVNSENLDLSIEENIESEALSKEPPFWRHTYIYSFNDIEAANKAQKKYYAYFKTQVLNGEYVDLNGNTNYAFILYFDFINEYKKHKDIKLLDQLFRLLGESCPETIDYSSSYIETELEKISNEYSIDKLKIKKSAKVSQKTKELPKAPRTQVDYHYRDYDPDANKLGTLYESKLGLTKKERVWLNKFHVSSNVFTSIEGCCVAIIRVYLAVFNELEIGLERRKRKLDVELKNIFEEVCKIENLEFTRYNEHYEKAWKLRGFKEQIFSSAFKTIENLVRKEYGNKRKLSFKKYHPYSASESFIDKRIGNDIHALILEKMSDLLLPDLDTLIALNTQNVNRWKTEFDSLKSNFEIEEQETFIAGIVSLEKTNQGNPNIENIFYEASKFIAKYNKVEALNYYAKYIYYDLKSKKINSKVFTKTVEKLLFKTEEQSAAFERIIASLKETGDIEIALGEISNIYITKRKKIKFDRSEIQNIEAKYEGTVELLNEYLVDETEKKAPKMEASVEEIIEIETTPSGEYSSIYVSEINMNQVQEELVKMIVNNSYELQQSIVEEYAIENGMFKNQLIDSINEACEACLGGEVLIEEEDENYIIEKSYYTEITK